MGSWMRPHEKFPVDSLLVLKKEKLISRKSLTTYEESASRLLSRVSLDRGLGRIYRKPVCAGGRQCVEM